MRIEGTGPVAPVLVLGIGNPSRGDDALGPLLIERLLDAQAQGRLIGVEPLTDQQLLPEHVLDLRGRRCVIIADACRSIEIPFCVRPALPLAAPSHVSHGSSPGALLDLALRLDGRAPVGWILALRGRDFGLGAPLSAAARQGLHLAQRWLLACGCCPSRARAWPGCRKPRPDARNPLPEPAQAHRSAVPPAAP